jgi:hypothetical protein
MKLQLNIVSETVYKLNSPKRPFGVFLLVDKKSIELFMKREYNVFTVVDSLVALTGVSLTASLGREE